MTKTSLALAALLAAAALPGTASASCFFVYGSGNQLVYRSTVSPVDLSKPISEGLRSHFSGGHLVMIPDETGCPDLLATGESQLFADLGFTSRSGQAAGALPVFRNGSSSSTAGAADSTAVPPAAQRRTAPRSK